MEAKRNMSGPIWSHRNAVPLLTMGVMVVLLGLYQANDSINRVSRQTALSTQLYEDSLVDVAKYDEKIVAELETTYEEDAESDGVYVPIDPDVKRRIAFVHIGKSGGTTIQRAFPRLNCKHNRRHIAAPSALRKCLQEHEREDSPLSSQLEMELHLGGGQPPAELKDYSTFMFSIRNPLARVISSYSFLHHNNTDNDFAQKGHALKDNFYKICFPTLPQFLGSIHYMLRPELAVSDRGKDPSEIPSEHSIYCQQLALAVLKGDNPLVGRINMHLRSNNKFYYDQTVSQYPEKEVVAVRMEHIWDDIKALDVAMGGRGIFVKDGHSANTNGKTKVTKETPTPEQYRDLCCLLWEDIETFQQIVNLARNLEYASKLETMQDVWDTCGIRGKERTTFKVEDSRTESSNSLARKKNGEIVEFSWFQWRQKKCAKPHWNNHPFSLAMSPPKEILSPPPVQPTKQTLDRYKRKIAFVHVGKTGGTTIQKAFPILECRNSLRNQKSPSLMAQCVNMNKRLLHPLANQFERELHVTTLPSLTETRQFTTFLFSIRNPLTRAISSYSFLHHNNTESVFAQNNSPAKDAFYKTCFPTLQPFLRSVQFVSHPNDPALLEAANGKNPPMELSDYCQHMAITVLKGRSVKLRPINVHLRNNYKFYHNVSMKPFPKKEVLALRTEHLWDDINALDIATGGTGKFENSGTWANRYAKGKKESVGATPEQMRDLCCILWDDIEIYQEIVNRARNLDYPSKLKTIEDVWNTCGINGSELNKYQVEDKRSESSNAIAREENGQIVLFSWFKWQKDSCRKLEEADYLMLRPPPSTAGEDSSHEASPMKGNNLINSNRSVAFVHVGKAGGNTVREAYPRLNCRKFMRPDHPGLKTCLKTRHYRDDSPFSQQCDNEAHLFDWPDKDEMETFTTFLWALRNPMSRAISAYSYIHHDTPNSPFAKGKHYMKENFYKKCFPTLQDLLQTLENATYPIDPVVQSEKFLMSKAPENHPQYCLQLAITVLKGRNVLVNKINIHLRYNYQLYFERTVGAYPGREVLAIRTEHLWDDFKTLDIATGGSGQFINAGKVANANHGKVKKTQKDPTPAQLRALCCILWEEIDTYQVVVNMASNMPYQVKLETMQDIWSTCSIGRAEQTQYQAKKNRQTVDFSWPSWSGEQCPSSKAGSAGGMTRALRALWPEDEPW